jgi:putative acetyltransferase
MPKPMHCPSAISLRQEERDKEISALKQMRRSRDDEARHAISATLAVLHCAEGGGPDRSAGDGAEVVWILVSDMTQTHLKPALRPFLPADAAICAAIAEASIAELTGDEYTESQQEAWIAAFPDEDDLLERLSGQLTLMATLGESSVGFASLEGTDHVDMLYVHPSAVRQGVATSLIDALERLAAARGAKTLSADVSDSAQKFFAGRGYVAQQRNTILRGDEWLGNTTMAKTLASAPRKPTS